METPTKYDLEEDSAAFCSILNVVIDSGMEEPTPLEPEEYHVVSLKDNEKKNDKPQKIQQKVPVIRVYGPVLRRNAVNPPLQCQSKHSLVY